MKIITTPQYVAVKAQMEEQTGNGMLGDQSVEQENPRRQMGKLVVVNGHLGILHRYEKTRKGVSAVCTVVNGEQFSWGYFAPRDVQTATKANIPQQEVPQLMHWLEYEGYRKDPGEKELILQQLTSLTNAAPTQEFQGRLF